MAVLKRKRDGSYYSSRTLLARLAGICAPRQVTPAGLARLRAEHVSTYSTIPVQLFIELRTRGLIYTGRKGAGRVQW